jgi:hypothetical protein
VTKERRERKKNKNTEQLRYKAQKRRREDQKEAGLDDVREMCGSRTVSLNLA